MEQTRWKPLKSKTSERVTSASHYLGAETSPKRLPDGAPHDYEETQSKWDSNADYARTPAATHRMPRTTTTARLHAKAMGNKIHHIMGALGWKQTPKPHLWLVTLSRSENGVEIVRPWTTQGLARGRKLNAMLLISHAWPPKGVVHSWAFSLVRFASFDVSIS
jgi:hypothetical protein